MKSSLKVGILGAGVIGNKRALAIQKAGDKLAGVFDIDKSKSVELAQKFGAKVYASAESLLKDRGIDCVIVATTTKVNATLTKKAVSLGKHVLAEKPLGKNSKEAAAL